METVDKVMRLSCLDILITRS